MNRQVVVLVALVLVSIGVTVANSTLQTGKQDSPRQSGKALKQESIRRIYEGLGRGRTIPDAAAATQKDIYAEIEIGLPVLSPFAVAFDFNEYYKKGACYADAIIIGTVKSKTSHLTADQTFLFTNYEINVEEVLKQDSATPLQTNGSVTVARTGGTMQLNGRTISALDKAFKPLEIGEHYLLFLSSVPDRGAYAANFSQGGALLKDDKIIKLTAAPLPAELERRKDASAFIDELRAVIASPCSGEQEGAQ